VLDARLSLPRLLLMDGSQSAAAGHACCRGVSASRAAVPAPLLLLLPGVGLGPGSCSTRVLACSAPAAAADSRCPAAADASRAVLASAAAAAAAASSGLTGEASREASGWLETAEGAAEAGVADSRADAAGLSAVAVAGVSAVLWRLLRACSCSQAVDLSLVPAAVVEQVHGRSETCCQHTHRVCA
jgi:hypothetical protein